MSYKQNVEENLQHFAQSIGLGELKLNEHNACGLCFDETMIVNMEYLEDDEMLVFVSSVKKVDIHDDMLYQLFRKSLSLNLHHHSMQGAYLALNNDQSELLLMKSVLASCDYGNFETMLEKFVNSLEWVIKQAQEVDDSATEKAEKSHNIKKPSSGDIGLMV